MVVILTFSGSKGIAMTVKLLASWVVAIGAAAVGMTPVAMASTGPPDGDDVTRTAAGDAEGARPPDPSREFPPRVSEEAAFSQEIADFTVVNKIYISRDVRNVGVQAGSEGAEGTYKSVGTQTGDPGEPGE
jgi:hypothetical protein